MKVSFIIIYIAVMAAVTYSIRALPMLLFKGKFRSRFLRSLLHYIPYGVLSALVFPGILYSSDAKAAALAGTAVTLILSFLGQKLLVVSAGAVLTVFLTSLLETWLR